MTLSEKLKQAESEVEKRDIVIKSLMHVVFGMGGYHSTTDLIAMVNKVIQSADSHRTEADTLRRENTKLYALVRFMSGDKDVFKEQRIESNLPQDL